MKAWKVQKFFGDIGYDLRSRGLLPVVGLLLVAMIAVPILISRGSTSKSTASLVPAVNSAQTAPETQRAVVSYTPGIRNYKKRLNDLSAKDPFHQQFSHSATAAASALNSTVSIPTGTSSGTSSSTATSTIPSTGGSGGSGGKKKKKKKSGSTQVTYQVNVLAGNVNATLTPFNNIASMTALPSQTTPVVIYFGLSSDASSALFLVSNRVATLTGPGTCVPSPDDCALLSLHAAQSEDLLYTQDGETYRIVVAQINRSH